MANQRTADGRHSQQARLGACLPSYLDHQHSNIRGPTRRLVRYDACRKSIFVAVTCVAVRCKAPLAGAQPCNAFQSRCATTVSEFN